VRPYLEKKKITKRAGGVAQGVGPEFKPSTTKQNKTKQNKAKQNSKAAKNSGRKFHSVSRTVSFCFEIDIYFYLCLSIC
jgi:hypothetical protein